MIKKSIIKFESYFSNLVIEESCHQGNIPSLCLLIYIKKFIVTLMASNIEI